MFMLRQSQGYGTLSYCLSLLVLSCAAWDGWPPPDDAYSQPCDVPPDSNHPLPEDVVECINAGTKQFCQPFDGQRICLHSNFTSKVSESSLTASKSIADTVDPVDWVPQTFNYSETTNVIISFWNKEPVLPLTADQLGIARLDGVSLYEGTYEWTLYDDSPWDNIKPGDENTILTFYAVVLDDWYSTYSTVQGPSITVVPPVAKDQPPWTGTQMVTTLSPTSSVRSLSTAISSTTFRTSIAASYHSTIPTRPAYITPSPTSTCYYQVQSGIPGCYADNSIGADPGNEDSDTTIDTGIVVGASLAGAIILVFALMSLHFYLKKRNSSLKDSEGQHAISDMMETGSIEQVEVYRPPQGDDEDGEDQLPPYMESRDNIANPPAYESDQVWLGDH